MNRDEIINDEAHPVAFGVGMEWRGDHLLAACKPLSVKDFRRTD
ncbi:hypothetical protein [Azotobacter beijerinckii]|nr:hypothetical protein [Azotobacter beijerinckii]MDV7210372.1 hypothetical protein [Azotobacter beijerinckii]